VCQLASIYHSLTVCKSCMQESNLPSQSFVRVLLFLGSPLEERLLPAVAVKPLLRSWRFSATSLSFGNSVWQCGHTEEFSSHCRWHSQCANFLQHGNRKTFLPIMLNPWFSSVKQNMQCRSPTVSGTISTSNPWSLWDLCAISFFSQVKF